MNRNICSESRPTSPMISAPSESVAARPGVPFTCSTLSLMTRIANMVSPTIKTTLCYGQANTHVWPHTLVLIREFVAVEGLHALHVFPDSGNTRTIDV